MQIVRVWLINFSVSFWLWSESNAKTTEPITKAYFVVAPLVFTEKSATF